MKPQVSAHETASEIATGAAPDCSIARPSRDRDRSSACSGAHRTRSERHNLGWFGKQHVERCRDRFITRTLCVLIDQGGARRRVPKTRHQLGSRRTRFCCRCCCEVTKVVQSHAFGAYPGASLSDYGLQHVRAKRTSTSAREEQGPRALFHVRCKVFSEHYDYACRQHDCAASRSGLGRLQRELTSLGLLELLFDADSSVHEVDVLSFQPAEFAASQPGEGRQQDEQAVALWYRISNGKNRSEGWDRPFGWPLSTGATDLARVPGEELIVDRSVEHCTEQSIQQRSGRALDRGTDGGCRARDSRTRPEAHVVQRHRHGHRDPAEERGDVE
jgi:hypothetical protein